MKVSKNKKWNEIKTNDSWSIFKIMGEFVEGYEKLSAIGPCISIFGSARTKPGDKYYKLAEDIAAEIVNSYGKWNDANENNTQAIHYNQQLNMVDGNAQSFTTQNYIMEIKRS